MGTKKPLGISSILTAEEHEEKKKELEEAEFKDELYTEGRDYSDNVISMTDKPKKEEPEPEPIPEPVVIPDKKELIDDLGIKINRLEILIFEQTGAGRWNKVRTTLGELKEGLEKLE